MTELHGDSFDYHLITIGVGLSKDTEGLTCEIGLRLGGGSKHIIDALSLYSPSKVHIAIDPYGSIEYQHKENHFVRLDYTNDMLATCMKNLHPYAQEKGVQFIFINLEDTEFFNRYSDGVPVYNIYKTIQNKYSFVHFDGPHAVDAILDEINFFLPRIDKGACFCFDDVREYYNHDLIDKYLIDNNFRLVSNTGQKALYQYEG